MTRRSPAVFFGAMVSPFASLNDIAGMTRKGKADKTPRMTQKSFKLGTRGSPLALKQAAMVKEALISAHPGLAVETVIIKTSGDWKPADGETRLSELEGGKGLFVREIERALMGGDIDFAVHSMKDVPSFLPEGLALDHVLPRADVRDAFICRSVSSFMDLPVGATVGTSSLRRQAFLLGKRPDLKVVPLRGNVQTRIDKMDAGAVDATFLAMAGLNRLGLSGDFIHPVPMGDMLPACGQGIVALETRADDFETQLLLDAIHHAETGLCGAIERAALQTLDGSCHTPIGAHARIYGDVVLFDLIVASGDGRQVFAEEASIALDVHGDAAAFGRATAEKLKARLPDGILA